MFHQGSPPRPRLRSSTPPEAVGRGMPLEFAIRDPNAATAREKLSFRRFLLRHTRTSGDLPHGRDATSRSCTDAAFHPPNSLPVDAGKRRGHDCFRLVLPPEAVFAS